jgi:hypothetical protein
LITKEKYYYKPTLPQLEYAVMQMARIVMATNVKKLAMPLIGCGLDRLNWYDVSRVIKRIFQDTDVEILVCKQ